MTTKVAAMVGDGHGDGQNARSSLSNDFRSLVKGGWSQVDGAVQSRMDLLLTSNEATTFVGTGSVRRTRVGWFYAHFCKLLGAPLVWRQGEDVTTTVQVAPTANGLRCWHRTFTFPDGSQQLVQTTKVVDPKLGMLDAVGAQGERLLATRMKVWTDGKSLHFASTGYVLRFRFFTLPIPLFLTPGTLLAEHRDVGNGQFLYILRFEHPVWGETFHQEGIFRMM
jgi:Domain of unknown function (DUF4166)